MPGVDAGAPPRPGDKVKADNLPAADVPANTMPADKVHNNTVPTHPAPDQAAAHTRSPLHYRDVLHDARLPSLERRLLLAHVTGATRTQLIARDDTLLDAAQTAALEALIQRRLAGEPMAYLRGTREFFGRDFVVSTAVLIPRPETELAVELTLQRAGSGARVLDLGTGSGAIAISIACERPDLQVEASDISAAALAVARHNALRLGARVGFRLADWWAGLSSDAADAADVADVADAADAANAANAADTADSTAAVPAATANPPRYDCIVANPPYIAAHDPHLTQGDLRFEPQGALTDAADGLSALRRIIAGAPAHLNSNGWLLLEHGYDQAAAVRQLLSEQGFDDVQSWTDLAGIERVSGGRRG